MNIKNFSEILGKIAAYSLYLNEMLAVCRNSASQRLAPAGPRGGASEIAPGDFVRTNPQDSNLRCAATPKGCAPWMAHINNLAANLERSPLTHSYGYGSADDRSSL